MPLQKDDYVFMPTSIDVDWVTYGKRITYNAASGMFPIQPFTPSDWDNLHQVADDNNLIVKPA